MYRDMYLKSIEKLCASNHATKNAVFGLVQVLKELVAAVIHAHKEPDTVPDSNILHQS